jgi:hypothetical protein
MAAAAAAAETINWTDPRFEAQIEEFRVYKPSMATPTPTPTAVQPGQTNNYENQ